MGTREGGREVGRREVGKGGGKKERESERERVMAGKMKWRRGTYFLSTKCSQITVLIVSMSMYPEHGQLNWLGSVSPLLS